MDTPHQPTPSIQPPKEYFLTSFKLPDVSFWQDDPTTPQAINFEKMAQMTRGVIIRAGQNLWEDNKFKISWKGAKAAGLLRGSYWFYDSRANPKRQAEKWAQVLGDDPGEMELWCDFEERYGGQYQGWRNWFDFMERMKALLPNKKLGVYTGYYYWLEFAAGVTYFSQYPLWIAAYNTEGPQVPPIWEDWTYWQFTDNGDGTLFGVESKNIDLNYFKGTEAEFLARYPTIQQTATIVAKFGNTLVEYRRVFMTQYSMTPITGGTRMRSDHNTSASVIASYTRGQLIVGDEIWEAPADGSEVKKGDKWLKVTSVDGVNVAERGWMAYIHKGVPICDNFKIITDPDPNPTPVFPDSFTLTDPSGAKAEYKFVRIIE